MYIVYLDEFGHIGPYVSTRDPKYKTHPIFGIAGFVIPAENVRKFSSFFYFIKKSILAPKIDRADCHPSEFEEKASSLFKASQFNKNKKVKREKSRAIFRLIEKVENLGGFFIYVGIEKHQSPEESNSKGLYKQVLKETIKRIDDEMESRRSNFLIVLDQQDDMNEKKSSTSNMRHELVKQASFSMCGDDKRRRLIEPPIQAESHLYQTVQFADWVCGIVSKFSFYELEPEEKESYKVFHDLFKERLDRSGRRCGIRKVKVKDISPEDTDPI